MANPVPIHGTPFHIHFDFWNQQISQKLEKIRREREEIKSRVEMLRAINRLLYPQKMRRFFEQHPKIRRGAKLLFFVAMFAWIGYEFRYAKRVI